MLGELRAATGTDCAVCGCLQSLPRLAVQSRCQAGAGAALRGGLAWQQRASAVSRLRMSLISLHASKLWP